MRRALLLCLYLGFTFDILAQSIPAHAIKNVVLVSHDGTQTHNANIVWRDGSIEAVGKNTPIPFDANIILDGGDSLYVYPGFIDGLSLAGSPQKENRPPKVERPGEPGYENAGIQPQRTPSKFSDIKSKEFEGWAKAGFTTLNLGLTGNMLPGQLDLVHNHKAEGMDNILFAGSIGLQSSFRGAIRVNPSTLMGVMTRFRQLWKDAKTLKAQQTLYSKNPDKYPYPGRDEVLESLYPYIEKTAPIFFAVDSKEDIERVLRLKSELDFNLVLISAKGAWRMKNELAKAKIPVLVSLDLPDKPKWKKDDKKKKNGKKSEDESKEAEVEEEIPADVVEFRDKQWLAYQDYIQNARVLSEAGILVGFASLDLKSADLSKELAELKEHGYEESLLVKIMTINTAQILGYSRELGKLEKGYLANFTVFNKPFTVEKAKAIYSVSTGIINEIE